MEKTDFLLDGCTVVPMNDNCVIVDGAVGVRDGQIVFVGKSASAERVKADERINAQGKVALPGFVNCHTHVPMTLFRGLADDIVLANWLKDVVWPLEAKLKADDVYHGALLGCLEMIHSGVTCFGDMYFHEDMVAKAVEESGLRACLAEGIFEGGRKPVGEKMFRSSVDFVDRFSGFADGRVTAMLGPHAVYSCSPELLAKVAEEAAELKVGVHMHLGEDSKLADDFHFEHKLSEVEFLDGLGFFRNRVVAAHCINLSANDRRILAKHRAHVVYVPIANMKLGLGAARTKDLVDLAVNVCFGTDGAASNNTLDMFSTLKFGALLQKLIYGDPRVFSAYQVLRMATIGGAEAFGLEGQVGTLEVGKKADVILVDFSKPHLAPLNDIFASLVYSVCAGDVDTVMVSGRIIMGNGQVRSLDEQKVMEGAEKSSFDLLLR